MDTPEMTIFAEAQDRVTAGTVWLDQARPGWEQTQSAPLDLTTFKHCGLGQVFGGYFTAMHQYGFDTAWAIIHGFQRGDEDVDYHHLRLAWGRTHLRARASVSNL